MFSPQIKEGKVKKRILDYLIMFVLVIFVSSAAAVYQNDIHKFVRIVFPQVTFGVGAEIDQGFTLDGNTEDFYGCLDDSADTFILGLGAACGTTPAVTISDSGTAVPTVKLTGQISPVAIDTGASTAITLTGADCGLKTTIKDATPTIAYTLPAVSITGCSFEFVLGIDITADHTITAAAVSIIDGQMDINGTYLQCENEDAFTFKANAALVGAWTKVYSDGVKWNVRGASTGGTSITCTT
ncbi:hypothetical protein LCGC14_0359630 [marine sediment metagenome]|uniref:Uncharacterized protein n=1 Tax=marine sediment metagenome TaxID=412755 RepID=A0A0F9WGP8_9ZZZZ|nr:hypothetical protein [Candidatus Aminicenantes bacterium]